MEKEVTAFVLPRVHLLVSTSPWGTLPSPWRREGRRETRKGQTLLSAVYVNACSVTFNYVPICADLIGAMGLHFEELEWTNPCDSVHSASILLQ